MAIYISTTRLAPVTESKGSLVVRAAECGCFVVESQHLVNVITGNFCPSSLRNLQAGLAVQ